MRLNDPRGRLPPIATGTMLRLKEWGRPLGAPLARIRDSGWDLGPAGCEVGGQRSRLYGSSASVTRPGTSQYRAQIGEWVRLCGDESTGALPTNPRPPLPPWRPQKKQAVDPTTRVHRAHVGDRSWRRA